MKHAASSNIESVLAKADPALARAIEAVIARQGPVKLAPSHTPPFEALVRAVVYQSLSGNVAAAILTKLKQAIGNTITPVNILATSPASILDAGLSNAKARTIHNLATWFVSNEKLATALPQMADEDIFHALTGIAGIGAWTVNVLLIFNFGRPDVLPVADIGIRRGVQLIYGLIEIASTRMVQEKAELWRPYRSIASMYVWQAMKLKLSPTDLEEGRNQ
jgi:DNA-3-methyladenine glycosylase II